MNNAIKRIYEQDAGENGLSSERRILSFNYPLHQHDFFEFEYIYKGKGSCLLNGTSFKLQPGTLVFCTPMDFASYTVEEPIHLLNVNFTDKWIEHNISDFLLFPAIIDNFSGELIGLFEKEYNTDNSFRELYLKNILCALLIETVRKTHYNKPISVNEAPSAFYSAAKYIRSHYREQLNVSMLADKFGYSSNYFSNTFRKFFNVSIPQFINNIRLEHATKLLLETNSSITDIVYSSGFSSVSNFMYQFKSHYNMSPSEFRKCADKKEQNHITGPAP